MGGAASAWRCIECPALYAEHHTMCWGCWNRGCIVPVVHRLHAALDYVHHETTARALAGLSFKKIEQARYPSLMLGWGAFVNLNGAPGAQKSTMGLCLADAIRGPALLVSAEEGLSPTLSARLLRCGVKRDDFHIVTRASVDVAVAVATRVNAASCVLDSLQESTWLPRDCRAVLEQVKTLGVLVTVSQVTKDGSAAGSNKYMHEADVVIHVESGAWNLTKSRYQDIAGIGGRVLREEEAA